MKQYFKPALASLVIVATFFTGCVKDLTGTVYSGPDLVEINTGPPPLNTSAITRTVTTTVAPKSDSVLIQLVGKQRSTPTNVTFAVNASSTAVVNTDYAIATPSPAVIAANTNTVWVKFIFNKVTSTKTLIIDLTGGDNVQPSFNYKTFTYTLK